MIIESIIFLCFIFALILSLVIRHKKISTAVGVIYTFFSLGTFLIFLSRIFLILNNGGVYTLENVGLHIWWHTILYLGIMCFIIGGKRLLQISNNIDIKQYNQKDTLTIISFVFFTILIFILSQIVEPLLSTILVDSFIDRWGLHHFIVFSLGVYAGNYVLSIRNKWGKTLSVGAIPIFIFITLTGLQHLWELLTESWKIINLVPEKIELVESYIVIASLISLNFGYYRTYKEINKKQITSV